MAPTSDKNKENKENKGPNPASSLTESQQNVSDSSAKDSLTPEAAPNQSGNGSKAKKATSKQTSKNSTGNSKPNTTKQAKNRSPPEIVATVNQILGLAKDTGSLPKIPKLTPGIPAQAAGSSSAKASDPIAHSTPVQNQVMYPYRPASMPNANQPTIDVVPRYLQDISNITPVHSQLPATIQNTMYQAQSNLVQPPSPGTGQPSGIYGNQNQQVQQQFPNFVPQYMGQPRTVDASSKLVVIPTPMYPSQPYVIADRNNIVTIPLGGHQNFPQPDFGQKPPPPPPPQPQPI